MRIVKKVFRPYRLLVLGLVGAVIALSIGTVFGSHGSDPDILKLKVDKVDQEVLIKGKIEVIETKGGRLVVSNIGSSGLDGATGRCNIGSSGLDGVSCVLPIKNGEKLLRKGVIEEGDLVIILGANDKKNRHEYIGHVTLIL